MGTFVTVGNAHQPFTRLLKGVEKVAHLLPQPVFVQHGHTPFVSVKCNLVAFMPAEEFERAITEADIVICHAGAGAIIHACTAGRFPAVMPRRAKYGEHIDDHQVAFARALADLGKVFFVNEPDELLRLAL